LVLGILRLTGTCQPAPPLDTLDTDTSVMQELLSAVERLGAVCPWTAEKRAEDMIHYTRKELLEVEEVFLHARHAPLCSRNLVQELGDVLFDVLLLIQVYQPW
jgi:NTP pyrophosphatase (non-canonical NTP hydrolase)